ncbi:uncharacterized protein [Chironomus tepperi]|uniref:uncharacterized protein n=1 Tax=Chironomus tepperi TaxID=113505 RepID=UPI00391F77D2
MDNIAKLDEREEKCKKFILEGRKNTDEDPWNFFKLSYPANSKIPWIVDCLEVRTTEKYGRGIYATRDLKPGDILCIDKSVINFIEQDVFYLHCYNCFKTSMLNLIPCNQTASMMFCSTGCMENFYSKSIDMELALHDDIKLLAEISAPFGGYKKLDNFISKTDLRDLKSTIFDYDFSNPEDPEYQKKLMICLLSLQTNSSYRISEGSCNIYNFVSKKTANHILNIYSMNTPNVIFNMFEQRCEVRHGYYISLFRSLINHSCLSNVQLISTDNKTIAFATKPIRAGEQLFERYFVKTNSNIFTFKQMTMDCFNFICDCEGCLNNRLSRFIPYICPTMNRKNLSMQKKGLDSCCLSLQISNNENEIYLTAAILFETLRSLAWFATFPF